MTENISGPDLRSWLYKPIFPHQWERFDLYSLATWLNGMAFRDIEFSITGKPIIKIAELKNGIAGQTKFTQSEYKPEYYIKSGDMLFAWSGQPETSIDVYWWRGTEGWLNQHIFKVTPLEKCNPIFFYYLLKYLKPNFISIASNKQTTGLGHVTTKDLKNLIVSLPDKETQLEIADMLGALDDKIELNRRTNVTLESMAQILFREWFVDGDEVNEWEVLPLTEIIEVNPSRSLKKGDIAPYLDMANMPTQRHRALQWIDRPFSSGSKFVNGDTLLARITPCLENGKTAFVDFLKNGQTGWGSTEYIVFHPKSPMPPEYGYYLARSEELRSHAIQNMTGTSGRQRTPASCFDGFMVVKPPVDLARKFGEFAKSVIEKVRVNDEENRTLASLRDTLLPKLMSGEVRVKEAEKES